MRQFKAATVLADLTAMPSLGIIQSQNAACAPHPGSPPASITLHHHSRPSPILCGHFSQGGATENCPPDLQEICSFHRKISLSGGNSKSKIFPGHHVELWVCCYFVLAMAERDSSNPPVPQNMGISTSRNFQFAVE